MSWDVPTELDCPACGQTMFKKSGRGQMKPFCINEQCVNFLPEDQRGYRKKPAEASAESEKAASAEPSGDSDAKKKKASRKTASSGSAARKKSPAPKASGTSQKSLTADGASPAKGGTL